MDKKRKKEIVRKSKEKNKKKCIKKHIGKKKEEL